jgi:hypothetical protein
MHDRSSKFRIYETSRAHNSEMFLSSGTQQGFIVQEPWYHGFVYGFSQTDEEWKNVQNWKIDEKNLMKKTS